MPENGCLLGGALNVLGLTDRLRSLVCQFPNAPTPAEIEMTSEIVEAAKAKGTFSREFGSAVASIKTAYALGREIGKALGPRAIYKAAIQETCAAK